MFDSDDNDFDLDEVLINDFLDCRKKAGLGTNNCNETADISPNLCSRAEALSNSSFPSPNLKHAGTIPKPSISNFSINKTRRRKFPGPAGILPERRNISIVTDNNESNDDCDSSVFEVASQGVASQSLLNDEPWQRLLVNYDSHPPEVRQFLDSWNVVSVIRKANARMLPGHKIPYLAGILHNLQCSTPDPFITLRDPTGEISGTLHRDVWQQFGDDIIVGSVLVLVNVGLLSVGTSPRRHYLNITGNNLASIYNARHGEVYLTNFKYLTSEDFIKTIEDWRKNKIQSPQPSASISNRSPLFTFSSNTNSPAATSPSLFSSPTACGTTPVKRNKPNFRNREAISHLVCGRSDTGGNSLPFEQAKENKCDNIIVPNFLSAKLANKLSSAEFQKPGVSNLQSNNYSNCSNSPMNNRNNNYSTPSSRPQSNHTTKCSTSKFQSLFQPKSSKNTVNPSLSTNSTIGSNHQPSSINCKSDLRSVNELRPSNNRTVVMNGEKRLLIESNSVKDVQYCNRTNMLSNDPNRNQLSNISINVISSCNSFVDNSDLDSEFEKSQVEDLLDGLDAESLFGDFD